MSILGAHASILRWVRGRSEATQRRVGYVPCGALSTDIQLLAIRIVFTTQQITHATNSYVI